MYSNKIHAPEQKTVCFQINGNFVHDVHEQIIVLSIYIFIYSWKRN